MIWSEIDQRIDNLTGIPTQPAEGGFRISVQRAWPDHFADQGGSFLNLHHDVNQAPDRVITVLIYLSDHEK